MVRYLVEGEAVGVHPLHGIDGLGAYVALPIACTVHFLLSNKTEAVVRR